LLAPFAAHAARLEVRCFLPNEVPGAGFRLHHYLQHWSWGKTGCVFRFQNPIRRFDFPIELLCFRFSARFLAFHWLTILFGPIKVF
jgi:hypothetical protein